MGIFGDIVGAVFGNSDSPGILGTGQYKAKGYNIDKNAFNNPVGDQSKNWNSAMSNMLGTTTGTAHQAANTQLGDAQTYEGAKIGPTMQAGGTQSGYSRIGPTSTYSGATLNGNQYNQVYNQQQALSNLLQAQSQGQGPSVAQVTAQQQRDANIAAQAGMLGSQRGSSNPALAQLAAANAGAAANQQAAQQAVMGRTQEALGAQANLANLTGTMGNQTQNWSTGQAGLSQQAQLQSMAAINAANQAQASLSQQNNQFNAQLGQQNNQFNTGAMNAANQAQAGLYQQAGLNNQNAENQFTLQQGTFNQGTNLANLTAQQQQNQLNAQQYNEYVNNLQAQNMAQYQGQMGLQKLQVDQNNALNATNAGAYQGAAKSREGLFGSVLGAAAAVSDKTAKTNIQKGNKELDNILKIVYKNIII